MIDKLISEIDKGLKTLLPPAQRPATRLSPAAAIEESSLNQKEKKHSAGLMRVNHSGEVCAQALYQGQALTAKLKQVREQMNQAAEEETDHLAWCEQRLSELGSRPSLLNPLWYSGSLLIGAVAGLAGDRWSLGFVAETEKQVSKHLNSHLHQLPAQDLKSRTIIEIMDKDEQNHAKLAQQAGGRELPRPVQKLMSLVSKIMTKTSYHI